jgi:LysR family cys regulon transcriptional activator
LFGNNVTHLGVKQGAYLRSFVFTFIELFSPTLTKKIVEQAMSNTPENYQI